jgi:hypothetical protein
MHKNPSLNFGRRSVIREERKTENLQPQYHSKCTIERQKFYPPLQVFSKPYLSKKNEALYVQFLYHSLHYFLPVIFFNRSSKVLSSNGIKTSLNNCINSSECLWLFFALRLKCVNCIHIIAFICNFSSSRIMASTQIFFSANEINLV